jgi:hypothetical protein
MPLVAAALTAGASLYGASKQASVAKKVGNLEAQTADQNRELAREQYEQNRATLQPQVDRGNYASTILGTQYLGSYAPRQLVGTQQAGYAVQNRMAPAQNASAQTSYLLPAKEQRVVGQTYTMKDGAQAVWNGRGFQRAGAMGMGSMGGGGGYLGGQSNAAV